MAGHAPIIITIKKRADFVALNEHASRFVVPSFILQMAPKADLPENHIGVGYTVTKKLGGAVTRNRIKRRLREAARKVMPEKAKPGHHYVFIGRNKALDCEFSELVREMEFAFSRIKAK